MKLAGIIVAFLLLGFGCIQSVSAAGGRKRAARRIRWDDDTTSDEESVEARLPMGPGPAVASIPVVVEAPAPAPAPAAESENNDEDEVHYSLCAGGMRPLFSMSLPEFCKEDGSVDATGRLWANFIAKHSKAIMNPNETMKLGFLRMITRGGPALLKLVYQTAMEWEASARWSEAMNRMEARITASRKRFVARRSREGHKMSVINASWEPIEENMRLESIERIERERERMEEEMENAIAGLLMVGVTTCAGIKKRRRGDDDEDEDDESGSSNSSSFGGLGDGSSGLGLAA